MNRALGLCMYFVYCEGDRPFKIFRYHLTSFRLKSPRGLSVLSETGGRKSRYESPPFYPAGIQLPILRGLFVASSFKVLA